MIFFQEELASLLSHFPAMYKAKKSNFPLSVNHGHYTDFSKLVNLCPVKHFSLISTPGHVVNEIVA